MPGPFFRRVARRTGLGTVISTLQEGQSRTVIRGGPGVRVSRTTRGVVILTPRRTSEDGGRAAVARYA